MNPAQRSLAFLRALRSQAEQSTWDAPEPAPPPDEPISNRLVWLPADAAVDAHAVPLAEARAQMRERIEAYLSGNDTSSILLVKAPPGTGKSHLGVSIAQQCAANGQRALYTGALRKHYEVLAQFPHFDASQWYEWMPMHQAEGDDDRLPTTCRHYPTMRLWQQKRYPSMALCTQLCEINGWLANGCRYRAQRTTKQPIIYAHHNHLAHGLAIDDFSVAIVDELPLSSFIDRRLIPAAGMRFAAGGSVRAFLDLLFTIIGEGKSLSGYQLLSEIAPALGRVYDDIQVRDDVIPDIPSITVGRQVENIPYWYFMQLLTLLSPEYEAYRHGEEHWIERVTVNAKGLILEDRKNVWDKLPTKMVILDATGTQEIYETLFERTVEVCAPQIRRPGRIFQITGRYNGSGTLLQPGDGDQKVISEQGTKLIEEAMMIRAHYPGRVGVVTLMGAEAAFGEAFGAENVLHYGALRGSNALQDVDALIIAGGYAPPPGWIASIAGCLHINRWRPFGQVIDGVVKPVFTTQLRPFALTDDAPRPPGHEGQVAWRETRGYWSDKDVQIVHEQYREAELIQAIHRARPNIRTADVWILTSVPTSERLNGVWDELPSWITGSPSGIPWQLWKRIQGDIDAICENGGKLTNELLAELTDTSVTWVRRQGWLLSIADTYPDQWVVTKLIARGRPKIALERS